MAAPNHQLPALFHRSLTRVKFKAILSKRMTTASRLGMLFQHQNSLASFGQDRRCRQAPKATAYDHHIQLLWHSAG